MALRGCRIGPTDKEVTEKLKLGELKNGATLEELLRRPEIGIDDLLFIDDGLAGLAPAVREQLEISVKYEGYIQRQLEQVERFRKVEQVKIPNDFSYTGLSGLSSEVQEKLAAARPQTLGQASRIPGVTPAAIAILSVLLRRK